ncbi:MAG: FecR domain-containing protein [Planctomycetota bacterium]
MADSGFSENLDELICTAIDGSPTSDQLGELNRRIADDPAVAARWVELIGLHVASQCLLGRSEKFCVSQPDDESQSQSRAVASSEDASLMRELVEQALETRRLAELAARAESQLLAQQERDRESRARQAVRSDRRPVVHTVVIPRLVVWLGTAAILTLVAVLWWQSLTSNDSVPVRTPIVEREVIPEVAPRPQSVGRLTRVADVVWPATSEFAAGSAGSRITPGPIRFEAGYLELELERGGSIFVEGPAELDVINDNHVRLLAGSLAATVPPSAMGFTVDTPTSRLIDIGTEFGVRCDPDSGDTTVQVYQGEVKAVAVREGELAGPFVPLLEGEAAEIRVGEELERVAFQQQRFTRDYASVLLNPQVSGDAGWLATAPKTIKINRFESPRARVFLESRGVLLEETLQVDFVPGKGWPDAGIAANTLPAGTRVDVYMVHMDSPGAEGYRAEASIEFNRPVLGGIGSGDRVYDTDILFGQPQIDYPDRHPQGLGVNLRGIDLSAFDNDKVWIDRSGTKLHIAIETGEHMDQFRVLVLSADLVALESKHK